MDAVANSGSCTRTCTSSCETCSSMSSVAVSVIGSEGTTVPLLVARLLVDGTVCTLILRFALEGVGKWKNGMEEL